MSAKKGFFIVIDGLDGVGKGEIERALIHFEQRLGRSVLDCISFSRAHRKGLPELQDFWSPPNVFYNTIITSDPSYAGIGDSIRNEITAQNGQEYDSLTQVQAYAIDRMITMNRTVIPALNHTIRVIQSRCVMSSLTYQYLQLLESGFSKEKAKQTVLQQPGNKLHFTHPPDLLIIPTIRDMSILMRRLEQRKEFEKDDNSIFDSLTFQQKLKTLYESPWLRGLFEKRGTIVKYLDASISIEESRRQAIRIYSEFLRSKQI